MDRNQIGTKSISPSEKKQKAKSSKPSPFATLFGKKEEVVEEPEKPTNPFSTLFGMH